MFTYRNKLISPKWVQAKAVYYSLLQLDSQHHRWCFQGLPGWLRSEEASWWEKGRPGWALRKAASLGTLGWPIRRGVLCNWLRFVFLWLVLSWKQVQKLGKVTVLKNFFYLFLIFKLYIHKLQLYTFLGTKWCYDFWIQHEIIKLSQLNLLITSNIWRL